MFIVFENRDSILYHQVVLKAVRYFLSFRLANFINETFRDFVLREIYISVFHLFKENDILFTLFTPGNWLLFSKNRKNVSLFCENPVKVNNTMKFNTKSKLKVFKNHFCTLVDNLLKKKLPDPPNKYTSNSIIQYHRHFIWSDTFYLTSTTEICM